MRIVGVYHPVGLQLCTASVPPRQACLFLSLGSLSMFFIFANGITDHPVTQTLCSGAAFALVRMLLKYYSHTVIRISLNGSAAMAVEMEREGQVQKRN